MKHGWLLAGLSSLPLIGCSAPGPDRAKDVPIAASAGALAGCAAGSAGPMNLAAFEAQANYLLELEPSAASRHLVCMHQTDPGLAEALMLYRRDLHNGEGAEAAFLHYVVNTPSPRLGDESADELRRLERRYRESLLLDARADTTTDTVASLADLMRKGQELNMQRYGRADRVPTALLGFDESPGNYSRRNAAWMAEMSALAYWNPDLTKRQLDAWGYELVAEITDAETETRAFLARSGQRLVLSFRGTSTLRNFKTDAQFRKVPAGWAAGEVHRGFSAALDSVWPQITAQLGPPGQANEKLWLTGHSLGAALAQLAALRLEKDGYAVAAVYTYGTPRIGDGDFVADYDSGLGDLTFAHINNDDIVTRVPPRLMGFRRTARSKTLKFTGSGHDLAWFDQTSQKADIEDVDIAIESIRKTTLFLPDPLRSPTLAGQNAGEIPAIFYTAKFDVGALAEHGSFQYLFKLSCVVLEKDLWPAEAGQAGLRAEDFDFSRASAAQLPLPLGAPMALALPLSAQAQEPAVDGAFLMPIEDVFSISGRGTVVTGRIERGIVRVGDEVEIVGIKDTMKTMVTGVEMLQKMLDEAKAGDDYVGVWLRGTTRDEVERGQVLAKPGSITPHTKFEAQVYVLTKEEGGRDAPIARAYRPQFYFRTTDVTGNVELSEGVKTAMPGDNVQMKVELTAPIAMEEGLRFDIREGGRKVGTGVVARIIE